MTTMLRKYKGYDGLRKKGFDYTKPGFYFITIDCYHMECRFGMIKKQKMIINEFGEIVVVEWLNLPKRYPHIRLHTFQIMPNHFHAILELLSYERTDEFEVAGLTPAKLAIQPKANTESLSDIIGAYKSLVSNECLRLHKELYKNSPIVPFLGKIWHRSFYDKIFNDKPSFKSISRYIRNNPRKWNRY